MKPKIKVEDLAKALQGIESDRQLSKDIVEDALKEALTKATADTSISLKFKCV